MRNSVICNVANTSRCIWKYETTYLLSKCTI